MDKNNLYRSLSDRIKLLSRIGVKFNSKINEINDDDTLLKFCKEKNQANNEGEKLSDDQKKALAAKIKENILSHGKNLSIETIFELSILLEGKVDFSKISIIYDINIWKLYKFNNLDLIFDFIKKHKNQNNSAGNINNYIYLIRSFMDARSITTVCVKDFLESVQFNFAEPNNYSNLTKDGFTDICGILSIYFRKDQDHRDQIAGIIENIFNYAPLGYLKRSDVKMLYDLSDNSYQISIYGDRMVRLWDIFSNCFYNLITLLSHCKDNSITQNVFDEMINKVTKTTKYIDQDKRDFCRNSILHWGTNISKELEKYGKHIFTPSIINFIKQKVNFNKDYDLGEFLRKHFEKKNFIEGDNCDLGAIFYRLYFENYMLIPHEKEDVIKLFESTKLFLPEHYRSYKVNYTISIKNKFDHDIVYRWTDCDKDKTNKIYKEMDEFVKQIFIEKGVIQKNEGNSNEIILENQIDNNYNTKLTLEELKTILLSNFKFGDYNITKQKFETLIPDKIDNEYYFRWILEFYGCAQGKILKEDFIFCVKRYKFTDLKDFNNFCRVMRSYNIYRGIASNTNCINTLLDACADELNILHDYSNYESYAYNYMKEVVSETQNKELADRINKKFNISGDFKLEVKPTLLKISSTQNIDANEYETNGSNQKSNKTPFWLIIITLGGVFWAPWLFKKIFCYCYNFKCVNVMVSEDKNRKNQNRNPTPNSDSIIEENSNNREN